MIKLEIDGKTVECDSGSMIIEAADNAGIYIPRFCYHKKLSIAANCRMCLVEVEKAPKPLPACATPVNEGMKVFTKSPKTLEAQKYVMEFLLINHPLDCPICDQGGECELQDLSMGFGRDHSVYLETKRAVEDDNLGPLIATDMTRCIHCTRCVRFSREIAGVPELGMVNRGEHSKITPYIEHALTSELSGNVIDLCPVGALTSKPYRYKARAWELEQHSGIAPHDCVGSNLSIHTRYQQVMRVVPRDNEAINETWLSDRDRFSYLGLQHEERIQKPLLKHQGQWQEVNWTKAFEYAAKGLKEIIRVHGADQVAALISPSVTLEEAYLLRKLLRDLGCHNIDYRIQQSDFRDDDGASAAPLCTGKMADISEQDCILLLGSNIRREQPILSNRVRSAALNDGRVLVLNPYDIEFNFPVTARSIIHPDGLVAELAGIAKALKAEQHDITPDQIRKSLQSVNVSESAAGMAAELQRGEKKMLLVGALALNHPQAALIKSLARIIATVSGARMVELTPGANAQGAHLAGARPYDDGATKSGLNAREAIQKKLKAYILFGLEPEFDCVNPAQVREALANADFVIAMNPYKSSVLEACADILLPTVPFTETDGTYVNAQGDWQTFAPVTSTYGEARPGWKVLRVFGNMLELTGYQYLSCEAVRQELQLQLKDVQAAPMKIFDTAVEAITVPADKLTRITEWPLYRIDGIVRRSQALQQCGANAPLRVRIHPRLAEIHQLTEQAKIKVRQNGGEAILPVTLDAGIPQQCVYVANGYAETAALGESFGEIDIEKYDD